MKNNTKNKVILVSLCLLLGFSALIFTNYQRDLKTYNRTNSENPNISQGIYTIANVSGHVWSPDGTKVAYVKSPNLEQYNCELWVAEKDPTSAELINHQLISSEVEYNGLLDWKGEWILYRIRREQGTPSSYYGRNELWKIRYNGENMTQVTFTETNGIRTTWSNPAYTNRGTAVWGRFIPEAPLVYFHAHNGNGWYRTYVCNDDGTDSWYGISSPDYTWRPGLSPTGNKLLWGAQIDFGYPTTHKACNVDGSGKSTIKAFSSVIAMQVLADGNTVVWTENDNIYAIDMDGTNQRTVLDDEYINRWYNYDPSNVQGLIMGSDRSDGNMHIYKINVDGTGIEQLTEGPYLDEYPALSPDGEYLSYLRLPFDFDKGSSTLPYPYELVIKGVIHDLSVSLEVPNIAKIDNSYLINVTVINIGTSDENNVELSLYLDDIVVDSIIIPNLPAGMNETINYIWTPTEYKTYNFTAYTTPVAGEIDIGNNIAINLITVYWWINYLMVPGAPYTWIDASGGTELVLSDDGYATVALPFEFQFYNRSFSTIYLGGNGYLSFTYSTPGEYSNYPLPSAYPAHHYLIAPFWDDLYPPAATSHIYVQDFGDHWVAEWLDIQHYPGSPLVGTFEVILYQNGDIVFSYDYLDYTGGEYTCGLNLGVDTEYYSSYLGLNDLTDDFSIKFSYEIPEHELEVSLEVPDVAELFNTYMINATIFNNGLSDETDVDLFLYLNSYIVESTTISNLPASASETINYLWTPTNLGGYNFSAYAPPVLGEIRIDNNLEFKTIYIALSSEISGPVAIFRNNRPWDMNTTEEILTTYGIDYTVYSSSDMGAVVLTQYEKVIIESDQDQLFYDTLGSYISWFESYAANGGILEIHACDGGWHSGYWVGLYLMPGGFGQDHVYCDLISINLAGHPVLNNPHIITDEELDGWYYSTLGYFSTFPSSSRKILVDSATLNPVFNELDYGEGSILITMLTIEWAYYHGYSNLLENLILFNPDALLVTDPDSSREWETDTSYYIEWETSGTISNVKLELYKDDVFVMDIIASTPNDGEYLWTIPAGLDDSTQYQIKISDVFKPSTFTFSEYFEIFNPTITISTPDSSSIWKRGSSESIYWTSRGTIPNVKLELYLEDIYVMDIIASTPNDGEFVWEIPSSLVESDQYQIKIIDVSDPSISDYSDYFEIEKPPSGEPAIPGYNLYLLIGIISIVSVILFKKRFNK
jgi:Tol biopolymer transport system component